MWGQTREASATWPKHRPTRKLSRCKENRTGPALRVTMQDDAVWATHPSGLGFAPRPTATSASESACGLTVQISPSAVAVASYSLVVTPTDAVTGAPPGQVWPPPLTVTSWAPQGYVVVTMCGAIELVVA